MMLTIVFSINYWGRFFDSVPGFIGKALDFQQSDFDASVQQRVDFFATAEFSAEKAVTQTQTHLIIIGESLTKNHLQVYGYSRKTTPFLSYLKQEHSNNLYIFDDAISLFATTRPALTHALSEINANNNQNLNESALIIDLLKKANYKTFWLSNQQSRRVPSSFIAALADKAVFLPLEMMGRADHRYDGELLPYIKEAFNDPHPHKIIFVHLMGSHYEYLNRYPQELAQFSALQPVPGRQREAQELKHINSYDNSVYYTDWLLEKIHEDTVVS